MNEREFNKIYRKSNLTVILLFTSFILMVIPAIAGVMLFIQTILFSWGDWTTSIAFNHYNEWWIEFVVCIGGFLAGLILWIIALIRWKNSK